MRNILFYNFVYKIFYIIFRIRDMKHIKISSAFSNSLFLSSKKTKKLNRKDDTTNQKLTGVLVSQLINMKTKN